MNLHFYLLTALGLIAAALAFTSDMMKNMLPLRIVALASNLLFIMYFVIDGETPHLLLQLALLPVNAKRLWDIHRLVRELKKADDVTSISVSDWLVPHMTRRAFKAGDLLFSKGDIADTIIYIGAGSVRLQETGATLSAGSLIGEIALFSPDHRRTLTVVCASDGELYSMTDEMLYKLYYLNPKLAFHLIRLIVQRLLTDVQKGDKAAIDVAA